MFVQAHLFVARTEDFGNHSSYRVRAWTREWRWGNLQKTELVSRCCFGEMPVQLYPNISLHHKKVECCCSLRGKMEEKKEKKNTKEEKLQWEKITSFSVIHPDQTVQTSPASQNFRFWTEMIVRKLRVYCSFRWSSRQQSVLSLIFLLETIISPSSWAASYSKLRCDGRPKKN